jgi:hypothetical protein
MKFYVHAICLLLCLNIFTPYNAQFSITSLTSISNTFRTDQYRRNTKELILWLSFVLSVKVFQVGLMKLKCTVFSSDYKLSGKSVCVCVCVWEQVRMHACLLACVCARVCVCVTKVLAWKPLGRQKSGVRRIGSCNSSDIRLHSLLCWSELCLVRTGSPVTAGL